MRYIWQHIQSIITTYNGDTPLTHYLKTYFKKHPILGSRDRKMISEMAYCWYRCSKGSSDLLPFEARMHSCLFLYSNNLKLIQPLLPPPLVHAQPLSAAERMNVLNKYTLSILAEHEGATGKPGSSAHTVFRLQNIFPYDTMLSAGIDKYTWLQSILIQPDLFIRVRKEKDKIAQLLQHAEIPFEWVNDTCMALPNATAIDKLLPDDHYVVQDASSQAAASFFEPSPEQRWWDCCSGAGGKSLYLKDREPLVDLTVSDIRASILMNLKQRFKLYHHKPPASYTLDVADQAQLDQYFTKELFDGIICDVPCTGSGTWARTPEQLYFFSPNQVTRISEIQQRIALHAAKMLAPGGNLYYITCSVFAQENEDVVEQILQANPDLKLQHMQLINGIDIKADSLFIAVMNKKR